MALGRSDLPEEIRRLFGGVETAPAPTPTPTPSLPPEPESEPLPTPTVPIDLAWQAEQQEPTPGMVDMLTEALSTVASLQRRMTDARREVDEAEAERQSLLAEPLSLLGEASQAYGQAGAALAEGARDLEARHRTREADEAIRQKQQLDALIWDFAPEQPSAAILQALAFRQEVPPEQMIDYARQLEGRQRLKEFGRILSTEGLNPSARAQLGVLSAGLIKEGVSNSDLMGMIDAAGRDDASIFTFDPEKRRGANRAILAAQVAGFEGPAMRSSEPMFPEGDRPAEPLLEPGLTAEAWQARAPPPTPHEAYWAEQDRLAVAWRRLLDEYGVPEDVPAEELRKVGLRTPAGPGGPTDWSVWGGVKHFIDHPDEIPGAIMSIIEAPFVVEQGLVTPFTRPVLEAVIEQTGIPNADTVAKYAAEFAVPSTLFPATTAFRALKSGDRLLAVKAMLAEGIVNMMQNRAGRETRGEDPPSAFEDAVIFAAGAVGSVVLPGVLDKVVGKPISRGLRMFRKAAPEVPAPEIMRGAPLEEPAIRRLPAEEVVPRAPEPELPTRVSEITPTRLPGAPAPERLPEVPVEAPPARAPEAPPEAVRPVVAEAVPEDLSVGTDVIGEDIVTGGPLRGKITDIEGPLPEGPVRIADPLMKERYRTVRNPQRVVPKVARPGLEAVPEAAPGVARPELEAVNQAKAAVKQAHADLRAAEATGKAKAIRTANKALNEARAEQRKATKELARAAATRARAEKARVGRAAKAEEVPSHRAALSARAAAVKGDMAGDLAPMVNRLRDGVRAAIRLEPAKAEVIAAERTRRAGRLAGALRQARTRERIVRAKGVLKGEVEMPDFRVPDTHIPSPDEQDAIFRYVDDYFMAKNRPYDASVAADGLDKIVPDADGNVRFLRLQPHEATLLGEVLGPDIFVDIAKRGPIRWGEEIVSAINIMRALMTGLWDWSFLLRQAIMAVPNRPGLWQKNARLYGRAFTSEAFARETRQRIIDDPFYAFFQEGEQRLFLPIMEVAVARPLGEATEEVLLGLSERTFVGRILNRLPGFRNTNRSATTFISSLRMDTTKQLLTELLPRNVRREFMAALPEEQVDLVRQHVDAGLVDQLKAFVNETTGRGTLGPLNKYTTLLNAFFFAPRFVAGKVTPLRFLATGKNWTMRKIVLREYVRFFGAWATVAGLLKYSGLAEVELDPRSTDFGKLKIGTTRLDIAGGYQPLLRYTAQIIKGQAKIASGDVIDIDRWQSAGRFVQSKLSPPAGLAVVARTGETFIGEEPTVQSVLWNNLTPLFIQDLGETLREGGIANGLLGLWGWTGVGVQSYYSNSERIRDVIADEIEVGNIGRLESGDPIPEYEESFPNSLGDLVKKDRAYIEDNYPDLMMKLEESTARTISRMPEREKRAASGLFGRVASEQATENVVQAGRRYETATQTGLGGPEVGREFREAVGAALVLQRGARSVLDEWRERTGLPEGERPEEPGTFQGLFDYFAIFDKYPGADVSPEVANRMFDEIADYLDEVGPDREAEIEANTGLRLKEIPAYRQLREDRRALRESGYFDRRDRVWADVQSKREVAARYPDVDSYTAARLGELTTEHGLNQAQIRIKKDPVVLYFNRLMGIELKQWKLEYPNLIELTTKWGYRTLALEDIAIMETGEIPSLAPSAPLAPLAPLAP